MAIHTRDYADRMGAVIGTLGGVRLGYHFFAFRKVSELIIHGHSYGNSPFIKSVSFLLTIGLCANLGRNGAVGIHDSICYSMALAENLYVRVNSCFAKTIDSNQIIEDSKNIENEINNVSESRKFSKKL